MHAHMKGNTWKSAIVEHQWDQQHQVDWDGTRMLDRATRPIQLKVKEALHIQRTPAKPDSTVLALITLVLELRPLH